MAAGVPSLTPTPAATQPPTSQGAPSSAPAANEFVSSLPEELRSNASLAKFKDAGSLAKSYTELEKSVGGRVKVPGADAKPEEWGEFYNKVGRPETPDKYEYKAPTLPEGVRWPAEAEAAFKPVAHQLGLTSKQVQGLMEFIGADATANHQARAQATAAAQGELKNEWGANYDKNLALTQRAFKELTDGGKDPIAEVLKETGLHADPRVLRFFHKLGLQLGEENIVKPEGAGAEAEVGDALGKIAAIRNNKEHAFHDPSKAGHKEAVAEMNKLYTIAYPGNANANL